MSLLDKLLVLRAGAPPPARKGIRIVDADAIAALGAADDPSAENPLATESGLADKAAATHGHAQADVTDLASDLAAKADTEHGHAEADVTT